MSVNENDFDALQSYLDGELPVSECEGLWRRLAVEPELLAALDRLRADIAMRQIVWSSMEPSDIQVARAESETLRAVRRHKLFYLLNRATAAVSVAAACILFGFTVGWLGHEKYPGGMEAAGTANPNVRQISNSSTAAGTVQAPGKYVVQAYDSAGRVVTERTFDTLDEARRFAQTMNQAQAVHPDPRDPFVVPVSGHF